MTKKHFIRLAEMIKDNGTFDDLQLEVLAMFCHEQNPKFNTSRWIGFIKGQNGPNGGPITKPIWKHRLDHLSKLS